jgi:glyoxylase-like metal-dependent hydrolase (beta-lactamase superfamily II)
VDHWERYSAGGENWFGFVAVRDLTGLPPEILLVPLPGHTLGHAGVAIQTSGGWLLLAGDAYFYHGEMRAERPHCPMGARLYQRMMDSDHASRLRNQERLRYLKLKHGADITVFCSHDRTEFDRLQSAIHLAPYTRRDDLDIRFGARWRA